jgi:hypothetical protein
MGVECAVRAKKEIGHKIEDVALTCPSGVSEGNSSSISDHILPCMCGCNGRCK